jgi:hypothetical protein
VPPKIDHQRLGRFIADLVAKKSLPSEVTALAKAAFPKAAWDFGRVSDEAFARITGDATGATSNYELREIIDEALDAAEDALRLKTMYERWRDKEVRVEVWDERDRLHIGIQDEEDPRGAYIVSWWDDDARQMFDDGFFKSGRGLEQSVIEYADEHGIFPYATGKNEDIQERAAKTHGHHIAVYNDKVVPVEMDNPRDEFKSAAMRVVDNASKGFVVTPKGEVFALSRETRMAKRVAGSEKEAVLATVGMRSAVVERTAAPRKPKDAPAADPAAGAMDDALSALSMAERQMERFISRADDPMGPMEDVAEAAADVVARARRGEALSARTIGQVGIALRALEQTFGPVYGPFAEARGLVYRAAEALGISTRRAGAKKESPPPLGGTKPRDLAAEVAGIGKDFHSAFRDVQEKSAKALNAARRAQDERTEDSVKAAVEAFLDFRDAVGPGYYAMLNGVVRRVDEMMSRMGRSRVREIPGEPVEEPKKEPKPSPKEPEAPAAAPSAPPKRGGLRGLLGL